MKRSPNLPRVSSWIAPGARPGVLAGLLLLLAAGSWMSPDRARADEDAAAATPGPVTGTAPQRAKDAVQQLNQATATHSAQPAGDEVVPAGNTAQVVAQPSRRPPRPRRRHAPPSASRW